MSHTINLYILKKSSIKNLDFFKDVPHTEENGYFLVPPEDRLIKKLNLDYMEDSYQHDTETALLKLCPDMIWAETDYFGGAGDQTAKAWKDGKRVGFDKDASINLALAAIGVGTTDKLDEFDMIGLGRYRSNYVVVDQWEEITGKTIERTQRRLILRHIPKEMELYMMEERVYTTMFHYIVKCTIPGNDNYIKYYSCNDQSEVKDIDGFDVDFFKETRILTTRAEFIEALPDAISHVNIEYVDDTIYKFQVITSYPVDTVVKAITSICLLDYQCDTAGGAMLHTQVKDLILFTPDFFLVSPYNIGVTGRQPKPKKIDKPKLIKKMVEVYQCPSCTIGELEYDDADLHKCTRCDYTVMLEV